MILGFVGYLNGFNLTLHQIRVRNGYGDTPYVGLRMVSLYFEAIISLIFLLIVMFDFSFARRWERCWFRFRF